MKNPAVKQVGFSLLETMIAMVVLAVGLVGLIGLQSATLRMNQKSRLAEVGRDILVSEIERIMPLSNLELKNQTKVGDQNLRTGLPSPYKDTLFSGVDAATPAEYDYVRWSGLTRTLLEDDTGNSGFHASYVVKIAIDEKYLLQDVLARGQVTVYWPDSTRGVDFLQTTFFIERK